MENKARLQTRCGILAAGNWIMDHVKLIDSWPDQDALATIVSQSDGNGGGPYNLLKDLARMRCGLPLSGIGLVGYDADGERILADCDAHAIDRSGFHQTNAAPTSYTEVMTARVTGRRTFFHCPGASALLRRDHFHLPRSNAKILYLGYLCLLERLDALRPDGSTEASDVFADARTAGMITAADLVSSQREDFAHVVLPSLPHLDYLFLNEFELARMAGRSVPVETLEQTEHHARILLERGVHQAVIVHFPQGALCVQRDGSVLRQGAVRVPPSMIAGTAGAGDAFAAGFVLGVHEGWDLQRCLELAVSVAASSLRHVTCSDAIEPWQQCLHFGQQLGFNSMMQSG